MTHYVFVDLRSTNYSAVTFFGWKSAHDQILKYVIFISRKYTECENWREKQSALLLNRALIKS